MSDTPQGPGWWLASDGRWYPPTERPATPPHVPPPVPVLGPQGWGAPQGWGYGAPPAQPASRGLAIASLVLGILWLCGVGAVLALIFGIVALRRVRRGVGAGKGMAIAGIVLGSLGILVGVVLWVALGRVVGDFFHDQPGERDDVTVSSCVLDDDHVQATLAISNDSSERSQYWIQIEFGVRGRVETRFLADLPHVDPGETVDVEIEGPTMLVGEPACRLVHVERLSAG